MILDLRVAMASKMATEKPFNEAAAAMEASPEKPDETVISPLRKSVAVMIDGIPAESLAPWQVTFAGGGLGYCVDPDVMAMCRAN